MQIFQVTIPAGGKIQISSALPVNVPPNTYVQNLLIQNNAAHDIRIGDSTVSATRGILLMFGAPGGALGTPGGSLGLNGFMNYGSYISDWWIAGTSGDVIDVMYIA